MKNLFTDLEKATEKAFNKWENDKIELCEVSDEIDAILQKKIHKKRASFIFALYLAGR